MTALVLAATAIVLMVCAVVVIVTLYVLGSDSSSRNLRNLISTWKGNNSKDDEPEHGNPSDDEPKNSDP